MKNHHAKIAVSVIALVVLVLRKTRPDLFDVTDLIIVAVGLLPWLSSLIKSAELPGGLKIEFQDLAGAGDKVTGGSGPAPADARIPDFVQIASTDANLALVALRIEIEKRVRSLASNHGIEVDRAGLIGLFRELQTARVLPDPVLSGLKELVTFGNQAAHGAQVDEDVARWAVEYGPGVIAALDDAIGE